MAEAEGIEPPREVVNPATDFQDRDVTNYV